MKSVRRGKKSKGGRKHKNRTYPKRKRRQSYAPRPQYPPQQYPPQQYPPQQYPPQQYPPQQEPGVLGKIGDAALFGIGADLGIHAAEGIVGVFNE